MKKIVAIVLVLLIIITSVYFAFIYYATFSDGFKAGELTKITYKGVVFKTWEGELSQGVSEAQRFSFSVESSEEEVIEKLKNLQGQNVKLTYKERFGTFPWLGDTKYFITAVEPTKRIE